MEGKRKYMNSYLAGVLLGLVIVASFFFTREGLGASGAFKRTAAKIEQVIIPDYINNPDTYFNKYVKEHNLDPAEILFMGDDIPDYRIMKEVGIPTCPSDAVEEIKNISKYVSYCKGGRGCVRDIIEQVLKMQNKWMNNDAFRW